MNVEKLKLTARKHEQREEWRKAIDLYMKAIDAFERDAVPPDLALYNRVGDLHMKVNNTGAAVQSYERAAKLYEDQGLVNNAIALCGKILRINPGKSATYIYLAGLHAQKNVVAEARRCLVDYLERMDAQGHREHAFKELSSFADRFLGNSEIRDMLGNLLNALSHSEDSQPQVNEIIKKLEAYSSDSGAADSNGESDAGAGAVGDLVFLDTGADYGYQQQSQLGAGGSEGGDQIAEIPAQEGLESNSLGEGAEAEPVEALDGLLIDASSDLEAEEGRVEALDITIEHTSGDDAVGAEDVDETAASGDDEEQPQLVPSGGSGLVSDHSLETIPAEPEPKQEEPEEPAPEEQAEPAVAELPPEVDREIARVPEEPEEQVEAPAPSPDDELSESEGPSVQDLEDRILDDPDNPQHHRDLGEALIASGETERGIEELELALGRYEALEDWGHASDVNVELLRLAPNRITYYQKRVELAYRAGDRARLIESYLALGDVLVRVDAVAKARAVYGRVLEHDPENTLARAALEALEPEEQGPAPTKGPAAPAAVSLAPAPVPATGGDFVDLGAELLATEPRDARMRLSRTQPTGDEAQDFAEILQAFKLGIEETIEIEDFQSHYDLGIAFKEMGLLDEAIAEFQKALRAPEGRLRTSEALGVSFYEKGQFPVSEAILRRAVDSLPGGDDEKIGLLYWLGRAREEQGKTAEALGCYQRAMAVDIKFQDAADRTARMEAAQ